MTEYRRLKQPSGPVWGPQPLRLWHGCAVLLEVTGTPQSSPCPGGHRAPLDLWRPQTANLSGRRSDQPCRAETGSRLTVRLDSSQCCLKAALDGNLVPRSSQGLMGSGCDQVSVFKGSRNGASCHQTADMSHVSQQVGVQLLTQLKHTQRP